MLAGLARPTQHLWKGHDLSSRHVTRRWHAQALSVAILLSHKAITEKEANLKTLLWFRGPPNVIIWPRFAKGISRSENRDGCAGVDFAFAARADDVARAVLIVAKKRAAAVDALLLVGLGRIEW